MSGARKRKSRPRWYYDACALEEKKSAYGELLNNKHRVRGVVSFLSLGEAYGNSHLKGPDQADAFIRLIKTLGDRLDVIPNDGCELTMQKVIEIFPRLSVTDALHLATALHFGCEVLLTTDRDLYGLDKTKLAQLAREHGVAQFSINLQS